MTRRPAPLSWRQRQAHRAASGRAVDLPEVSLSEIDGVRFLHLGTPWVQGAMRIRQPLVLELEYVQRMVLGLLLREDLADQLETFGQELAARAAGSDPGADFDAEAVQQADPLGWQMLAEPGLPWRIVQLGLGAGALTRYSAQILGARTVAVELNPAVIAACRRHFALPADGPRLRLVQADAREWLDGAPAGCTELLHIDLYDQEAAAPVLDDVEFYRAARRLLAPGGSLSVNLFGRHSSFERSMALLAEAFGVENLGFLPPTRDGNTVALAYNASQQPLVWDSAALRGRALWLSERLNLPAERWVRAWQPWKADPPSA